MDKDYGAIVTQPSDFSGCNVKPDSNVNVANGLNSILEGLSEIVIHQHVDAVEVCMGWERNNRYSIFNEKKEQILYLYEAAQCFNRQCYGSLRELNLILTDNDDNRLLQLYRPLRCSSRCCYACCHLQEMQISLPSKENLGNISERWSCCIPSYEIQDEAGNLCFVIHGNLCHLRCCCSIHFRVRNVQGETVSDIKSVFGGCHSVIGAFNEYIITYSSELSATDKVRIMASSFLLDFNYFQRHGKCF